MRSLILITTYLVARLCFISLPISTIALTEKPWPNPSQLVPAHHHHEGSAHLGKSKVGWTRSSVSNPNTPSFNHVFLPGLPNIPELPNIPWIPNIPGLPSIPEIPNIPRIPNISGIPNIPGIRSIPRLPSVPEIPNIPRIPNIPMIPNIPGLPEIPNVPRIPNIPRLPSIPGFPRIPNSPRLASIIGMAPLPSFESVILLQSAERETCLAKDESKIAEKCFSQIFSSRTKNDFALAKECCGIVVKMDKKCNSHVRMLFKSRFFVPFLRYSCHIKRTKN